jgi:hypothetical protein
MLVRASQPSNAERPARCTTNGERWKPLDADGGKSMSVRAWVLGLAVTTTTVVGAEEPLSIRVSPAMSFAPANLVIRTRIEPDPNNRAMEVVADSDGFYRSSAIQLEGDRAPKTTTFEFRSLPPGTYEITAVVLGARGERRALARAQVNVLESGESR